MLFPVYRSLQEFFVVNLLQKKKNTDVPIYQNRTKPKTVVKNWGTYWTVY